MKLQFLSFLFAAALCITEMKANAVNGLSWQGEGHASYSIRQIKASIGHIDTPGLIALIESATPMVLIDTRYGEWDKGNRIPGAISLNRRSTPEEIASYIPGPNSLIVVYCTNKQCPASKMMAKYLLELGYQNVLKYSDGIEGWIEAGQSVEQAK